MHDLHEKKFDTLTRAAYWLKNDISNYGIVFYLVVALFSLWYVTMCLNSGADQSTVHIQMISAILILAGVGIYWGYKQKIDYQRVILILIILGCIMRIGYCAYNDVFVRAHDLWNFDDYEAAGKGTYLMGLIKYKRLPDSYDHQYYHQPFSYIASAIGSLIIKPFLDDQSTWMLGSAGKVANCFASCAVLIMTPKLCKELKLPKIATVFSTALVAAFPGFLLISGRIGEDAYSCLFALACILYTLKWEKNHSWKNTILLALFFGFGVNTNLTCFLPIVYTLFVVIKSMYTQRTRIKEILCKGGVFTAIFLSTGFWFYLRNYIMFKMPLTYTYKQEVGGPLYTGDKTIWERFIPFDFGNIAATPYAHAYGDHNLPTYFLKSELFGEFEYGNITEWVPYVLLYINIFITILAFLMIILKVVRRKTEKGCMSIYFMLLVYLLFTAYSYYTYPFGCSMDARYFLIFTLLKAVFVGIMISDFYKLKHNENAKLRIIGIVLSKLLTMACLVFVAFACGMFCIIV